MRGKKRNYIREWRQHRQLTLVQLAARLGINHGTLSKIERGRMPFTDTFLDLVAEQLQTDNASLLMRDPTDPEGIWSVWDRVPPTSRPQALAVLQTFARKQGTDG